MKSLGDAAAGGLALLCLSATLLACQEPSTPSHLPQEEERGTAWFVERGTDAGIHFEHHSGDSEARWMPEIMTGGAALFDADGDDRLDLFLVQGRFHGADEGGGHRLYRNAGPGPDGRARFVDVTEDSGELATAGFDGDPEGWGMGVATGDVDGDGDVDLYLTRVGPNALLLNDGEGAFTEVAEEFGVADPGWGSSAAFFDAEGDGDLDLFVTNYLVWSRDTEIECLSDQGWRDYCSPQAYDAPAVDVLYRNLGPAESDGRPRFERVRGPVSELPGTGLGLAVVDFDGDHRPEIFVANDGMPDRLWVGQETLEVGFPRFEDHAVIAGCAVDMGGQAKAGMGVAVADVDHDGDPDLLVCNLDRESDSLFLNEGGVFVDATLALGLGAVSRPFTRFGMAWVDFDNDGNLDLYQANGRVALPASETVGDPFAESNLLFRGLGENGFEEVVPRGGTSELLVATSRAAAFGDLENDGGVDVVVVNRNAGIHLLHNIAFDRGHWLVVDVRTRTGAPALGAEVWVVVAGRRRVFTVRSAYSYQAANDPRIHVGLGEETRVQAVEVRWPDGSEVVLGGQAADRILRISPPATASKE